MKKKIFLMVALATGVFSYAQNKSTGVVTMGQMTAKIDLDGATSTVTYTLTGPSSKWFALGINATTMSTNTPIDCIQYGTTLLDRHLTGGHNQPTTDSQDDLTLVSNTVNGTTRTIVATRPFNTGDSKDYTYTSSLTTLTVIWAIGPNTSVSNQHNTNGSKTMTFSTVAGTEDIEFQNSITLYPVPAANELTIQNHSATSITAINVYDVNAKLLLHNDVTAAGEITVLNTGQLANGLYFMEITGEDGSKTVKKFEVKK